MTLLLQLRLLLWKNFVNRKRQKLRCAVELVWPLTLFLLLMWVRSKGFHKSVHQCHFAEKALPSSGQLMFYQGVICTLNNTCNKYPTDIFWGLNNFNSSKFNEILEDVNKFAKTSEDRNKTKLNAFLLNLKQIADELTYISELGSKAFYTKNITILTLEKIDALHMDLDKNINEMKPILNLLNLLDKIEYNYDNLSLIIKEAPFLDDFFLRLQTFVCGNQPTINLDKLLHPYEDNYGLNYFFDFNKITTTLNYEYDPESSELCNEIYKRMETTKSLKFVWRILKPFVRGKIIFSPNTTVIQRIIKRVQKMMAPPAFPSFDLERKSLSLDSNVYEDTVNNLNTIKDTIRELYKYKLIYGERYSFKPEFHESILKAENIIKRLDERYSKLQISNFTLAEVLECYGQRGFEGYETEMEAEQRSMALCDKNDLLAYISFSNTSENALDPLVSYKIRFNSERVPHPSELQSFRLSIGPSDRPLEDLKLITYGFLYIQDLFEKSIITELTGKEVTPRLFIKQIPYPCYIQDWFMSSLSDMFPLFMVLSWVYTSSMIVKSIVHEKEQKLKETMCVLGLNNGIYWCSWFIDSIIPMTVTVCLLSTILVYGGILANADITLVIVFLMIFAIATINQSFLFSVCFSKANQAASSSGIIYFITYLPYPFIIQWHGNVSTYSKFLSCVLSNVALGLGSRYFSLRESEGTGCRWSNVSKSPVVGDAFNLLLIMFILIIDSFIYLLIAWYIANVFPGNYGIPKRWNFLFQRSYWCPQTYMASQLLHQEKYDSIRSQDKRKSPDEYKDNIEPVPDNLKVGVSVINLCKTYKNRSVAISDLNINFYEDQITAFLGRNGAGKTTTISILTGLFPPTSGTAKIYGMDVRTDMNFIRQNLGICPQYNLYFNCFTVEEHLWFFARLKGHSPGETQIQVQQILHDLGLTNKKRCLARYLSGGMKRKLSVAIAFIGGSRTVILDEPTAGVDPYSRIGIWELIQKNKKGRTIILTTHTMSEAELLGDRIAIFANGDLLCCGSSTFLKSKFGWGIILTVDLNYQDGKENKEKTTKLINTVNSTIPNAKVMDKFDSEIKFNLPKINGNLKHFHDLFYSLDNNKNDLGINTYGIADTSLEEIFMKLVGEHDKNVNDNGDESEKTTSKILMESKKNPMEKPSNHWKTQFIALQYKRLNHYKRSKLVFALELILPTLFVCLCMVVTNKLPTVQHPSAFIVDISNCTNCSSFYEFPTNISSPKLERYARELTEPGGIGIKCTGENKYRGDVCTEVKLIKGDNETTDIDNHTSCSCDAGVMTCPLTAKYGSLPGIMLGTGQELFNVTGVNISQWILNTWSNFGSKRTGGYSFGVKMPSKDRFSLSDIFNNKQTKHRNDTEINQDDEYDNIMIWFNNKWTLSPVAYLNAINNMILRSSVPSEISHNYGIKLTIHHMNYTAAQYQSEIMLQGDIALLHSVSLIFSLSFIPTAFILYLIEERNTNSKHLQFLSGVDWKIYWIQAFIWDISFYFVATLFCALALIIFGAELYVNKTNFPCLLILILLYGWANIPFMYPASFFFQVSSSAFVALSCLNLFIGLLTTATTYVLRILKDEYLSAIEINLRQVLLIFPHFCLGEGVMKLAEMYLLTTSLAKYNIKLNINLYSWDYLGKNFTSLFIEGIVFFIFTLFYEKFHNQGICPKHLVSLNLPEILDDDVKQERNRILTSEVEDNLVLKCLTKIYKPNNFLAVNQISLGVKSGQCLGLLGLNGAGKTTTFMMLTGATTISFGDATINNLSIRKDISKVSTLIGYCPQNDALDPKLTSAEHLHMYARLRNIPKNDIDRVVSRTLISFDLVRYKDISTKYLSGGNKRKLSTAIAILGYPTVIFLDEPTSGMDPKGRRFLWARIRETVMNGHVVVLTTHNMHECEALCSRVTIMAHGQLMCLGTVQHIKNKFGQGYNLVVWASYENLQVIEELFATQLPEAVLKSSHHTQIKFYLPSETLYLPKILDHLEDLKKKQIAYDYSLSQKTLDEIFLHFVTKHSYKGEIEDRHQCNFFRHLFCNCYNKTNRQDHEKFVKKV